MQDMTTRGGHYTALLETIGARGATKLHADEREQLLAVADALLFGDPDSEQGLARALDLITGLQESERWSAESCASTSTAADRSPRGPERGGGARPPITGGSPHGRRAACLERRHRSQIPVTRLLPRDSASGSHGIPIPSRNLLPATSTRCSWSDGCGSAESRRRMMQVLSSGSVGVTAGISPMEQ
jgi:hypothetical protein